jgi:hypothetical protein
MADMADGHRGDQTALDGAIQAGPGRSVGPLRISGENTALARRGRGSGGKCRERDARA